MSFGKDAYDGKEVAQVDQGKEVYAASAPSHAYQGKELANPAYADAKLASPAYTDASSRPDKDHNAPIPIEHTEKELAQTKSRGLSRKAWIIILAVGLILILCLGLGLGLGLGLRSKSNTTNVTPASATATTAAAQTVSTTASSSTSSSSAAASPLASTSCPSTNGTTYTASGHSFLILCQNDIKADNTQDLGRVYQPSFNACIDSCATVNAGQARSDVSAVYWVDYDAAARGTCWCIGGTSLANNATTYYNPHNNLAWIRS